MEFVAKIDPETGNYIFPSRMDEARYRNLVEFYKQTGRYFRFQLMDNVGHTTSNQIALFKRLVTMVSNDSGEDWKKVYDDLHKQYAPTEDVPGLFGPTAIRRKNVSELNRKEFEDFLNNCILMVNDIFNANLVLYSDDEIGTVLTKNKE